jgi:hypothetical protein
MGDRNNRRSGTGEKSGKVMSLKVVTHNSELGTGRHS